jgi:hypothetical protein
MNLADSLRSLAPVHHGHGQIHQHKLVALSGSSSNGLNSVVGNVAAEAKALDHSPQQETPAAIVVNNQHTTMCDHHCCQLETLNLTILNMGSAKKAIVTRVHPKWCCSSQCSISF